ncbi:hypothetical protein DPMN_108984 [Dreissena polymorpha]|uniref:Uncharacterized protein n=1 Tax=Dreissena polymorpha TaxID=45954 RepID=A0A9D4K9G6_DREPO|nr:hypothetical protein DPMN_108984 [Dreissena polymorpha]
MWLKRYADVVFKKGPLQLFRGTLNIWKDDVALRLGLPWYSLALHTGLGFAGLFHSFLQGLFRIVALLQCLADKLHFSIHVLLF